MVFNVLKTFEVVFSSKILIFSVLIADIAVVFDAVKTINCRSYFLSQNLT